MKQQLAKICHFRDILRGNVPRGEYGNLGARFVKFCDV